MHCWHDVKPTRITPENFLSLIEISKGSKNKYELDKETGHLILLFIHKIMVLFLEHSLETMTHLMS